MLGAICPKDEAEEIFRKVTDFLKADLKLNISQAKSGLKHNSEIIRFLGYDITTKNTDRVVKGIVRGQHYKKRSLKAQITLSVPEAKLKSFAEKHQYGHWNIMLPKHIPFLNHVSDAEILMHYSAEMRGIAQYYALADNFSRALGRLRFLWVQSFLCTMGDKHKMSMQKMATLLDRGGYLAVREKDKEYKLFRLKEVKREANFNTEVDKPPMVFKYTGGSELLKRMGADKCEYCEKANGYFEVHHVRKLADVKEGKQPWQRLMIARQRKTLVLCITCHQQLHAGKLPDRRHLLK